MWYNNILETIGNTPLVKLNNITKEISATVLAIVLIGFIGKDVFPKTNSSQFQLRMRAVDGTRLERTEEQARIVLKELETKYGCVPFY